ncbi:unnamed protein product [Medioppia subpectinata]|uniref:Uncharacterized protein n=1 Tax=Medioppia subpectinata TaxID=1979941 RepID=A0A7R9LAJ2_9ACAR|nr:unnamed protein product [Medioppia subpectinata]CAG2117282.1 unnamed protein product [Medioppia subpectinata]
MVHKSVNKSMIINNNTNNIIRVDENPVGICRVKNCRSLCNVETIDAVLNYRNGSIFAFKGNFFWQIMDKQLSPTLHTRKEIGNYWNPNNTTQTPFLGPISAAFKDNNGFTYLFKLSTL